MDLEVEDLFDCYESLINISSRLQSTNDKGETKALMEQIREERSRLNELFTEAVKAALEFN